VQLHPRKALREIKGNFFSRFENNKSIMKRYALNPSIQNFDGKVSFISIESLFEKTSELKSRVIKNSYTSLSDVLSQTINHIIRISF